jgi:heme iron utilization protein
MDTRFRWVFNAANSRFRSQDQDTGGPRDKETGLTPIAPKPDNGPMTAPISETDQQKGATARAVVRALDRATLATAMAEHGTPYASLVMTACDPAGCPLMMLSDLAEHTKNLQARPEASLLFDATAGLDNALTGTRVALQGSIRLEPSDDTLTARYLARHPDAEIYTGFADFNLYRMTVERVHVVAGFGQIHWLAAEQFLASAAPAADLTEAEHDIIAHMNDDHSDAVRLYATMIAGGVEGEWNFAGIDCDGIDLRLGSARARIPFDRPVFTSDEARKALAGLAQSTRKLAENS